MPNYRAFVPGRAGFTVNMIDTIVRLDIHHGAPDRPWTKFTNHDARVGSLRSYWPKGRPFEVRVGSKREILTASRCCQLCPRKPTLPVAFATTEKGRHCRHMIAHSTPPETDA